MNFSLYIAKRYFFSNKKKSFINVISIISMFVVAIGSMCLILVLSVFNGMEDLMKNTYGRFDADLIIQPKKGKSFTITNQKLTDLKQIQGVKGVAEIIEDNVLVKYKNVQRVVRMKGVSEDFERHSSLKNSISSGKMQLTKDSLGFALIGRGVQYDLSLSLQNDFYDLQVFYPKNVGPGVINPSKMFQQLNIKPKGVFAIEKKYDENYIFVPIKFASNLLNYGNKRTSLEIYKTNNSSTKNLRAQTKKLLGTDYNILESQELHTDLFKILRIEKLFVFIILISIIAIASVNIYFSLTMLAIDKKKDITVLFALGTTKKIIRNIFLLNGSIIAFTGAFIGMALGIILTLLQQKFGFVKMGVQSAIMDSYPIKLEINDVIYSVLAIIIITVLASYKPASKASNAFSADLL